MSEEIKAIFTQVREFIEQKKYSEAIRLLQSISRENSSPEQYAKAQLILGHVYEQQGNLEEAEAVYKNVVSVDSTRCYAMSMASLANLYRIQAKFELAETTYNLVLREYDAKQYAKAQIGLGLLYEQKSEYKQAETAYKNIVLADSTEWYAMSLVNLGNIYGEQGQFELAETTYNLVLREYDGEQYARAQFGLGYMYAQDNNESAEQAYRNVLKEHSGMEYAKAQWNLSILKNDHTFLKNIKREHDIEIFGEAQFKLGIIKKRLASLSQYWRRVPKNTTTYINKKYLIDISVKISEMSASKYKKNLFEALIITNNILDNIFVDTDHENSIAHYTNVKVSKLLLSYGEKVTRAKSPLRLNTINLMNDPVEGRLLHQFLGVKQDNENLLKEAKNQAFIACFTLHHDSLNQFRLYGKHDNQEASGLSLVLNKEFFASTHNAASMYRHSGISESGLKGQMIDSAEQSNDQQREMQPKHSENNQPSNHLTDLPKSSLYRCIYLDPVSNYIKVAQREEWSFCREDECPSSDRWENYQEKITEIEDTTRDLLNSLSEVIQKIKLNQDKDEVSQVLSEILRPLKYLIKHMAFKEEQECRMVFITKLDDELVKFDEKNNRIYIDYGPSVMEHLEKIYLAPKAKDEQIVFEYLCTQAKKIGLNKNGVKVKISQNPFR